MLYFRLKLLSLHWFFAFSISSRKSDTNLPSVISFDISISSLIIFSLGSFLIMPSPILRLSVVLLDLRGEVLCLLISGSSLLKAVLGRSLLSSVKNGLKGLFWKRESLKCWCSVIKLSLSVGLLVYRSSTE